MDNPQSTGQAGMTLVDVDEDGRFSGQELRQTDGDLRGTGARWSPDGGDRMGDDLRMIRLRRAGRSDLSATVIARIGVDVDGGRRRALRCRRSDGIASSIPTSWRKSFAEPLALAGIEDADDTLAGPVEGGHDRGVDPTGVIVDDDHLDSVRQRLVAIPNEQHDHVGLVIPDMALEPSAPLRDC